MNKAFSMAKLEIEENRKKNIKKFLENRSLVYKIAPRILHIDKKLSILGVSLIRTVLEKNERFEKIKKRIIKFQRLKKRILCKNDFPENFLDEIKSCKECGDLGYIENKQCKCLVRLHAKYRKKFSNVHGQMIKKNFTNFDFSIFEYDEKILKRTKRTYKTLIDYSNLKTEHCHIFITGNSGTGKSYISLCVANKILENKKDVCFQSAYSLADSIDRVKFNKIGFDKASEALKNAYAVEYLIIDDLGSEFTNSIITATLLNIIEHRIVKKRPIIINSNLTFDEVKNKYGTRIASRIVGEFEIIKMHGKDLRFSKNKMHIKIGENQC